MFEYMDVPWLDAITPIAGSPAAFRIPHSKSLDIVPGADGGPPGPHHVHRDHSYALAISACSSLSVGYLSSVKSSLNSMARCNGGVSTFGSSLPLRTSTGA